MTLKILIAEDNPGTAEIYKRILESENYTVVVTDNGEDCIRVFDQELHEKGVIRETYPSTGASCATGPFDLVVLDYHMPLKDGIDVARHILSKTPSQRILLASAYPKQIVTASAQGLPRSVELMLKPFDLDRFAAVVGGRERVEVIECCHR